VTGQFDNFAESHLGHHLGGMRGLEFFYSVDYFTVFISAIHQAFLFVSNTFVIIFLPYQN